MNDFINALTSPDFEFVRLTFIVGVLSSIAFGIMGTYVVARRIVFIAGAISHTALAGIGLALYLNRAAGIAWADPAIGAAVAAVVAALVIGLTTLYGREREDTAIGAVWAIGMAIGMIFLAKTPGYVDPMSYFWGNILLVSQLDIWFVIILDVCIIAACVLFYNKFLAICFDDEFARVRGIRTHLFYLLLLCLTALTVVVLVKIVGIVMVIALLTIPAAAASLFSRSLWQMMLTATLLCMLLNSVGIGISYIFDLPTGPSIIILAGAVYIALLLIKRVLSIAKP